MERHGNAKETMNQRGKRRRDCRNAGVQPADRLIRFFPQVCSMPNNEWLSTGKECDPANEGQAVRERRKT